MSRNSHVIKNDHHGHIGNYFEKVDHHANQTYNHYENYLTLNKMHDLERYDSRHDVQIHVQ